MQRICELFLLLLSCAAFSLLLQWRMAHRPTTISGTVIDWTTGKPVAGVHVWSKGMKGASEATRTDERGRFKVFVKQWEIATLLASDDRFGPLLRATFARAIPVYAVGQQEQDVVLPVFPATELSGHIYDELAAPKPGCKRISST